MQELEYPASLNAAELESVFGETEEMELAAELLEVTDERGLDPFISQLIARVTAGRPRQIPVSPIIRRTLKQTALAVLPTITVKGRNGSIGNRLAAAAGDLFGLELEGLSPEDQEFEVARRFVRFAGAGVRNAGRIRRGTNPSQAMRRALGAAARRHAPGLLRPPRRFGHGTRAVPLDGPWPGYAPSSPIPISVTCHCCGASQTDSATAPEPASDLTPSPDTAPATTTEPQSQPQAEESMHDLDRTTLELSDESEFEFGEQEGEQFKEDLFHEEEENELAASLLEINNEQELDQFISSLLKKARSVVGGALKSPLLRPLGGFIKGAIKKALPVAGGALGNLIAPGIGGQIGSRLASSAGGLLGLELEGVSVEDQEFEVAKRLVRMAGTAIQNAAQSGGLGDPQSAAKSAILSAVQSHVPGLLQSSGGGGSSHRRPATGRWYRRGRKIVLVGV